MSLLLENTIKVSFIVVAALATAALFKHRSAALRHWLLSVAIACAVVAPAFRPIAPSWTVQIASPLARPDSTDPAASRGVSAAATAAGAATRASALPSGLNLGRIAGVTWITGLAISLIVMAVGFARLTWIASKSERLVAGRWAELGAELARRQSVRRRIRLLQSAHPSLLVTWGLWRPAIILPEGARRWSEDRIRVVLLHELAHIRRGDWLTQLVAECLRAVYWFNPLVWVASRRLRQESEHACDDAVLSGGVAGPEYATHLLDLARSISRDRTPWLPAPAMARPSSLERRFVAMLNPDANRRPITRPARFATSLAITALSILVAGFGAAQTFSTFSGLVFDSTNRVVPQVTVTLINPVNQATYSIKSDATGRFEFVGLPPGDYAFEAGGAGFATLKGKITVAGRNVQRDISLEVGSLEETISVVASASAASEDASRPVRRAARQVREAPQCEPSAVGGVIKPPVKLVDVRPRFPENARMAGIGGVVVLDARIATDGTIREANVVSAPSPDLGASAVEAVRQWEFSQTLLNCEPIEVRMKVTVGFRIQP
jgi:TonB family protein